LSDKFQRYILAPKWLMLATIRWMSVTRFVEFSFKLAQWTRSADWFGRDPQTAEYVRQAMLEMATEEYLKIYDAIYEFDLLDLAAIRVPTLVLNGEYESKAVFRHTEEMLRRIPEARAQVISGGGHTSNMENPAAFNAQLEAFLLETLDFL
jgi:pimeloyl-ACP methyl ester carboxylesterase